MKDSEIEHLIRVAKNLKAKRDKNQITAFEEAELKEIYKLLIVKDKERRS
ncbi:hypothetical protein BX659_102166 [Orenia metallireducens]|jgi:hypothetical protein|uniref:Uncharacterized protein n=1 Tax=Orenia metallireducens TaxID=1413210 RepID=A0A285F3H6_9FIRM|nr:hypothetical protein [Orenia metallireducens]PRX34850.1 hypothetical protein BX659_102166 [Orenia metallireducens]SNY05869.1 hypothetical protein SAMN06265827_101164 [Orenia metallireducens]